MATMEKAGTIIAVDRAVSVYSGRPGCACGCRGKHIYASAQVAAQSKRRGYEIRPEEVSDRSVALMVKKVNRLLAEGYGEPLISLEGDTPFVSVETETRLYIIYLGQ